MRARAGAPWIVYALGALLAGAIVAAVLLVGPASGQRSTQTRIVTAQRGVVQSTVSGSGNIAAASELNLGFKTSGTVSSIDIAQGQHVTQGQLLATLDPQSAEVTLEQAKAALQSAEADLAREEETDGESSSQDTSGSSGSGASGASATSASTASIALARTAATDTAPTTSTPAATTTTPVASTPTTATTSPATTPTETPASAGSSDSSGTSNKSSTTQATKSKSTKTGTSGSSSGSSSSSTTAAAREGKAASGSSTSGSSATSISTATREANIASAKAAVRSDRLTVESDEEAVADTRLLAPENGTIVSLGGEVGETVSGGGTSRASSGSESSSSTGSSSGAGGAAAGTASSGSSSSSSSSASSSFAVLSDLSSMKLVVPLSESEVGSVKAGQPATVTIEALKSAKLAAHVSEVAALSTSNSGVVSYDVTFTLDQLQSGLKAGMSATAEVVVAQAEGVNVPTSAITGGSVTVLDGSKQERRSVTTGLAGDSSTLILSGLNAGERVALPLASTSGTSSLTSRLGAGGAAGGGLGAAGGLGGAGGAAGGGFARGAGGFTGGRLGG
jgi:multidrug efflux pump subunit AcrA (membrane-fusion protein)